MADLHVDTDQLRRSRRALAGLTALLEDSCAALRTATGEVGPPRLVDRLEEFVTGWDHGVRRIGALADGCDEALSEVSSAFEQLERELASAVRT